MWFSQRYRRHRQRQMFLLLLLAMLMLRAVNLQAETVTYDGLIEPDTVVEIGAPAEGIVAQVAVDRSSPVVKGQILIELESSVERMALAKAEAMAAFEGDVGLQRTHLAFAKRAYRRVRHVTAVSNHDKDQAATEVALTEFRLKKARENQLQAQLELKKAQAILARRSIRSPIDGVVVERYVSPGEYVNTQPLLRVARIDPLRVEVIVPAKIFGRIRPGMAATIVPEFTAYGEHTAYVAIVDKVIDAASSTFGVRLELPNPDARIPSGLKCVVRFNLDAASDPLEHAAAGLRGEVPLR
ncbi:MAG: efflux RND transporter periplasmic adaptor subunit [Desulfosarcinaceae bacterium]|nr:efflux RND transporter periplasmic adaptor subunit [Desulfosarcinaceae bacterium]